MNAAIIIVMEDPILHHLPSKPFCTMPDCPCHHDLTLIGEYLLPAIERGITWPQARVIWEGKLAADFDLAEVDRGLLARQDTQRIPTQLRPMNEAASPDDDTTPDIPAR